MATPKKKILTAAVYHRGKVYLPGDPVPEGVTFEAASATAAAPRRDVVLLPGAVDVSGNDTEE